MKKWEVIWKHIDRAHTEVEVVSADYCKLEEGSLVLRKLVPHAYPEVVHIYAPGRWLEVKERL